VILIANVSSHDFTEVKADPDRYGLGAALFALPVPLLDFACHSKGATKRVRGIMGTDFRGSKIGHKRIANIFIDGPIMVKDGLSHTSMVAPQHRDHPLRPQAFSDSREAHNVNEKHGNLSRIDGLECHIRR
jgi:hypothetical protein